MIDGPSIESAQIGQPERPAISRPPEIKPAETPIGQAEQQIISQINENGDPDSVLEAIAAEQSSQNEPPIIGGEVISPTSVLEGETTTQLAQERGWLAAITSAFGKQEISIEDKQKNVQAIVDAARAAGVPKDRLETHLLSLGITITPREKEVSEEISKQTLTQEKIAELKRDAAIKAREYQLADQYPDSNTPTDLMIERNALSDEVGQRFEAHGIAKGLAAQQLDFLLNLLDKGVDPSKPFYTTDLYRSDENELAGAVGAAGPYDTGGFIILGEPRRAGQTGTEMKEKGVAGVLVNREWYDAIPDLEKAYPNVRFIRADQMNEKLTEWVQSVDNKK